MTVPLEYQTGFAAASLVDPVAAERYVRHSQVGDPEADALIGLLQTRYPDVAAEWIRRGIEGGAVALPEAPGAVREFFSEIERVPGWFDPRLALSGCRAFHRHSEMFLGAFVGAVLIEGFSTLISKSFCITGRLVDQGVRRLKQNNRHLVEIFIPGGLDRRSDGWKLSVRIRLIHAQVRYLLRQSPEWDEAAWGVPLGAAHIAYATAAFSALLLKRAEMLGVRLSAEERASFLMIWRYSGHLMGVVPELLFTNEQEALHLHRIGTICEPPPGVESLILANGLINSAPIVAGITETKARRELVKRIYQVSRALIGDEMADRLNYPPSRTFGVLALFRWRNWIDRLLQDQFPAIAGLRRVSQFEQMLKVTHYGDGGLGYRMPAHVHAERDQTL